MAKKIVRLGESVNKEKKYKIRVVSQAIGLSEGAVSGYFKNRGGSVSGGLTAKQVAELLKYRDDCGRKFNDIDWDEVDNLIAELETLGWRVIDREEN